MEYRSLSLWDMVVCTFWERDLRDDTVLLIISRFIGIIIVRETGWTD